MEHNAQFYDGPFLLSKYACNPLYYLLEFGTINKICFIDLEVPHYLSIFVIVMMMKAFKVIICLLIQFYCTQALVYKSEAQCSGQVCIPMDYEKVDPPFLNGFKNWMDIELDKIQIQKVDDIEKTISLSVEIYLLWKEPRLNIKSSLHKNHSNDFSLEKSFLNLLWIPDIYIYDAKKVVKNHITSGFESLKYYSLENITQYCVTLNIDIFCHAMDFDNYPFDSHTCYFEIGSYTYPKVTLDFNETKIYNINSTFSSSEYLIEIEQLPKNRTVSEYFYSKSGFQMKLHRNIDNFLFNCYVPTALMVITSWVNLNVIFYLHTY